MAKRVLEHCPFYVVGGGKLFTVAANNGSWNGYIGRHDWVNGILGNGSPVSEFELSKIRAGGGHFSWWVWEPNTVVDFPVDGSPVAYVEDKDPPKPVEPKPVPKPRAETPAVRERPKPKAKRGRPKKADKK